MKRDSWLAIVACLIGCVLTVTSHASPTGSVGGDRASIVALTLATCWCAARCPWQVLGLFGFGALAMAPGLAVAVLALIGAALAIAEGSKRLEFTWLRMLSWAFTLAALLRSEVQWFFGFSAIVTGLLCCIVIVQGLRRATERANTFARWVGGLVMVVVLGAVGLAAWKSWSAVSDLRNGREALSRAQTALRASDSTGTSAALNAAAEAFASADDKLASPWARPARAVPVVAQHLRLLRNVASSATAATQEAALASARVDLDTIGFGRGSVDLAALRSLQEPSARITGSLDRLNESVEASASSWLLAPVEQQRRDISDRLVSVRSQAGRLSAALTVAPSLLGDTAPRTYFVAFLNPAEARGAGGFMGNWAVVRADAGRVSVVTSGRTLDLYWPAGSAQRPTLKMSDEFFSRYAGFGARQPDGKVALDYWANASMTPDLPTFAEQIVQMLPSTKVAQKVDGVITIDVQGIAAMMRLGGPIQLPLLPELNADNVAQFLLTEQYRLFGDSEPERAEVLGLIAEKATTALFTADISGPRAVADALGPATAAGHIQVWSSTPKDQESLRLLDVSGELIAPAEGQDSLGIVVNNAGGNKLDAYLERDARYDVEVAADGTAVGTLTLTLTNSAPTDLPKYAAGNVRGLPEGTNSAYLSLYSGGDLRALAVDGTPVGAARELERGYNVYSTVVNISRGESVTLEAQFALDTAGAPYSLRLLGPFNGPIAVTAPRGVVESVQNLDARTSRAVTLG